VARSEGKISSALGAKSFFWEGEGSSKKRAAVVFSWGGKKYYPLKREEKGALSPKREEKRGRLKGAN